MNRRVYLSAPHMGDEERRLLLDAFDSNWIAPLGPHVDGFEQEIAARVGSGFHAAALSSGTAGIHLALRLAGIGSGDRVLVSSLTFCASANAITYVGAIPVFLDSDKSWNLDPDLVEEAILDGSKRDEKPRALVAVDLYGACADYGRIAEICQRHEVLLIEDAAEALGANRDGKSAGSFGDFAVFSFNGNKIITTSGGGALVARDPHTIERARFLASQAREPAPHYEHNTVGYNYRLSNLLAAVGRGQLGNLDARVARKREISASYHAALQSLPGVEFMPEVPNGVHTRWLTTLTVDPKYAGTHRERIREVLAAENIESRPVWKPMHLQPAFRECRMYGGTFSSRLFDHGLCLPSWTAMTEKELHKVIELTCSAFTQT